MCLFKNPRETQRSGRKSTAKYFPYRQINGKTIADYTGEQTEHK